MRNRTLRRFAQVAAFIAAAALQHGAHAVQITLNLPDCPSGQALSFNAANNTLSCGAGNTNPGATYPGSCSISAQPPSDPNNTLAPGTPVTLTATCGSGTAPISYHWNLGFQGAALTPTPTTTTTYVVTPTNPAGQGSPFSTTVYISGPTGPSAPSGCSITQSPNTAASPVAAGTQVALSLTCGGGGAISQCTWSNGIGNSGCTVTVQAPSAQTTYSATASNTGGSATAQTTVFVSASTGNGNNVPPAGQNLCSGSDQVVSLSYPNGGQVKPRTSGFGNQKYAFKFTVPTTFSPALNISNIGFMRVAEIPGAAVAARDFTVSRNACDFTPGNNLMFDGLGFGDTAPMVTFTVNNPTGYKSVGAMVNVNAGETIYFNIRNGMNGVPSCPFSTCDILFDFASPNRY